MQPHQQRVVDEIMELGGRIERLESFTTGQIYVDLAEEEKDRLQRQLATMKQLSSILEERIVNFPSSAYQTPTIAP